MNKILIGTLIALSLLGTTAPGLATTVAHPESTASVKRLAFNGLQANGIRKNGLSINGIRKNGFRKNGLPSNSTVSSLALHLQALAAAPLTR
jgi:hypothetical protein